MVMMEKGQRGEGDRGGEEEKTMDEGERYCALLAQESCGFMASTKCRWLRALATYYQASSRVLYPIETQQQLFINDHIHSRSEEYFTERTTITER